MSVSSPHRPGIGNIDPISITGHGAISAMGANVDALAAQNPAGVCERHPPDSSPCVVGLSE
jgi:hypothetical protein